MYINFIVPYRSQLTIVAQHNINLTITLINTNLTIPECNTNLTITYCNTS